MDWYIFLQITLKFHERNRIMAYRTHNCNELTFDNLNERVSLAGWVDTIRDHGGVAFIEIGRAHV